MTDPTFATPPVQERVARQRAQRGSPMWIPPLLIIPFVLYNIIVFFFFGGNGAGFGNQVFSIPMASGTSWALTWGDLLIVLALALLFFEVLKSTGTGNSSIMDHMFSTLVLILYLVEFLLVAPAATSTFFILLMMALTDLVAGFSVSIRGAGRDVSMN